MRRLVLSQWRLDRQDRRDRARWDLLQRGAVVGRRCPRCGEGLVGDAKEGRSCPRGHGVFKEGGISVPERVVREVYRAYETARLAEEYLPEAVERMMVALRRCRCGVTQEAHKEGTCGGYEPAASVTDAALAVRMLAGLSRHEVRLDKAMGVTETKEKDPIVAGLIAAGITLDAFKRMSVEERAERVRRLGTRTQDAEVVDNGPMRTEVADGPAA